MIFKNLFGKREEDLLGYADEEDAPPPSNLSRTD